MANESIPRKRLRSRVNYHEDDDEYPTKRRKRNNKNDDTSDDEDNEEEDSDSESETTIAHLDLGMLGQSGPTKLFNGKDFFGNKPLTSGQVDVWNIFNWYFRCSLAKSKPLFKLNFDLYNKFVHLILRFYEWELSLVGVEFGKNKNKNGKQIDPSLRKEIVESTMLYQNVKNLSKYSPKNAITEFVKIVLGNIAHSMEARSNFANDERLVSGYVSRNRTLSDPDDEDGKSTLGSGTMFARKKLLI
ncbi:unnamed protein product [Ambrosiozyma monospora]|uniref:Unnamed protein product n=1 Tax=Ambrosiozyma monospora TaxID=43982 RepID=A0ACB5U3A7_AMBMO|nr:unnamed protein product [Ambrosiozyma monospora]